MKLSLSPIFEGHLVVDGQSKAEFWKFPSTAGLLQYGAPSAENPVLLYWKENKASDEMNLDSQSLHEFKTNLITGAFASAKFGTFMYVVKVIYCLAQQLRKLSL